MNRIWYRVSRWWRHTISAPISRFLRTLTARKGPVYWLTFQWLWQPLSKFVVRFFQFKTPWWFKTVSNSTVPRHKPKDALAFFNPIFWFVWVIQFPLTWVLSRPYLNFGPGLPAFIVLTFLLVGWATSGSRVSERQVDNYRKTMNLALADEDYPRARIAARVLNGIFPGNLEYQRQLATIEIKLGNKSVAAEMMSSLVQTKNDGNAALWLITNVLDMDKMREWQPDQHQYFLQLIQVCLQTLKGNNLDVAKGMMGYYLAELGNSRDALRYFSDIAPRNPRLNLIAADLAKKLGDDRAASDYGSQAYRYFRQLVSTNPNNVELRIAESQALQFMGDHEQALAVLGEAFAALRDERLRNAIAAAYVQWSGELRKSGDTNQVLIKRLELLRRATVIAPQQAVVSEAIADLVIECAQNENSEIDILRTALVQGISPGMMHFIEGTAALIKGDPETARSRLELASQTMENVPALLNNLASAMASGSNENLPRALELVNMADQRMPNHTYIRETRGQIYFKMGEFAKSIPDLEFSLQSPELRLAAYDSLRKSYKEIGQLDLANQYEKLYDDAKLLAATAKDTNLKSEQITLPDSMKPNSNAPIPNDNSAPLKSDLNEPEGVDEKANKDS